jgi:C1A family cysteine protease
MISSAVFLLGLLFAVSQASVDSNLDQHWQNFKGTYGKTYATAEEEMHRRSIWENNHRMVEQHNKEYAQGKHTYNMEIKSISDRSVDEVFPKLGEACTPLHPANKSIPLPKSDCEWVPTGQPAPQEVSLVNYCQPVQNQGLCESCWSFSIVGTMECQYKKEKGSSIKLSEQNLVDCVAGNSGCCKGTPIYGFGYAKDHGVWTDTQYGKYYAKQEECHDGNGSPTRIATIMRMGMNDENKIMDVIANHGVVSAGIDVDNQENAIMHIGSGIYKSTTCRSTINTHAIVIVGFGTDGGVPYWLIRNSWGTDKNINGNFKLFRGSNMCGIARSPIAVSYSTDVPHCPRRK